MLGIIYILYKICKQSVRKGQRLWAYISMSFYKVCTSVGLMSIFKWNPQNFNNYDAHVI